MFNAAPKPQEFVVPVNHGKEWQLVVDTERPDGVAPGTGHQVRAGDRLELTDRSMVVLQRPA
jgi:glycogen operon protein